MSLPVTERFSPFDVRANKYVYDIWWRDRGIIDGWDFDIKFENFRQLTRIEEMTGFPIAGASVLDIGCGSGDFSLFLQRRGVGNYVGIDVYARAVNAANLMHMGEHFVEADFLAVDLDMTFDYAFCSGGMSVKLDSDNYTVMEAMVGKMWNLATKGIGFNFLTDENKSASSLIALYNTEKVLKMCRRIDPEATIMYLPSPIGTEDRQRQCQVLMYRNAGDRG